MPAGAPMRTNRHSVRSSRKGTGGRSLRRRPKRHEPFFEIPPCLFLESWQEGDGKFKRCDNSTGGTFYAGNFISLGGSSLELVPIPEPATILGAGALLVAIAWRERRRIGAMLRKLPGRSALTRAPARF